MSDDLGLFTDPDVRADEHEQRPRRSSAAARKARKRKRTVLWVVVALVLGMGGIGAYYGYQVLSGIGSFEDFSGSGETDVIVEVKDGDPVSAIATTLKENGVVASARAFTEASKTDARVTAIQPGFYLMKVKMSGSAAVTRMVDPKSKVGALQITGGKILRDLTGGDGKVVPGILTLLSQASCAERDGQKSCVPVEELKVAAETADPAALGVPEWAIADVAKAPAEFRLEGLIVRGVYQVNPGLSAVELLKSVITASVAKLQGFGIPNATGDTGFRPYEVLVMASLVEKEAIEKDFGKVSRVIYNRLAEPMPLQFDSTVNFKLNQPHIRTSDADRNRAGAYNTYVTGGLTPTPISSPSREAIAAALKPDEGTWKFFVKCQKDGTSCFAETREEHDANDQKAQRDGVF